MASAQPRIAARVGAKECAKYFYELYGFQAFEDAENKLFITIADVRAGFGYLTAAFSKLAPTLRG